MGILLTTSLLFVHLHVYMSKLKIKLTKLWTGLAGIITTKNLGDLLSYLTTSDSNRNLYWKIERKKGRTISSLHLQCHKLTTSLSLSLSSNGLFCGKLLHFTLSPLEGLATSKTKISKLFGFQRFTYTAASFFFLWLYVISSIFVTSL